MKNPVDLSLVQLDSPLQVGVFRNFVQVLLEQRFSGYQVRKLFKLTHSEYADYAKLKDPDEFIDDPVVVLLFNLYSSRREAIPAVNSYEKDMIDFHNQRRPIPNDRLVRGEDLCLLKTIHRQTTDQARSTFGLPPNNYAKIVGEGILAPVLNPAVALMTRYWCAYPGAMPKPREYTFDELQKIIPDTPRNIGLSLGKQESSGHRWQHGVKMTPAVRVCAEAMVNHVLDHGYESWVEDFVLVEGRTRNIDNVYVQGDWNKSEINEIHANRLKEYSKKVNHIPNNNGRANEEVED
ncbi:TPA: hypothetical protein RQN23_002896 [Aeromonas veronii]|nr:hypothetical protein [Aeromonas veronii]